jgi:DNA-binding transcriptional ArsR family regulator
MVAMMDSQILTALADPVRRSLLVYLVEQSPKTATQLAQTYPITRQGILKHLNVLEDAGLVSVHQKGREKRYTPQLEKLTELERWIRDLNARWDARLVSLKHFVESLPDED